MKAQLTIRGLDKELQRRLLEVAKDREWSLNKAAVYLMLRGAGLTPADNTPSTVGDRLDEYFGVWDGEEEAQFRKSTAELSQIDEDLWR